MSIPFLVIFSIIIFDQATKALAVKFLQTACNQGIAFGLLPGNWSFVVSFLVIVFLCWLLIFARRTPSSQTRRMNVRERIHTSEDWEYLLAHVNLKIIPRPFRPRKFIKRGLSSLVSLALALIIGGGISNLMSRLGNGCVLDFVSLAIWPSLTWLSPSLTRWPAFNLADAAITVGVGVLIFSMLKDIYFNEFR